jgi:hypothetical protein
MERSVPHSDFKGRKADVCRLNQSCLQWSPALKLFAAGSHGLPELKQCIEQSEQSIFFAFLRIFVDGMSCFATITYIPEGTSGLRRGAHSLLFSSRSYSEPLWLSRSAYVRSGAYRPILVQGSSADHNVVRRHRSAQHARTGSTGDFDHLSSRGSHRQCNPRCDACLTSSPRRDSTHILRGPLP